MTLGFQNAFEFAGATITLAPAARYFLFAIVVVSLANLAVSHEGPIYFSIDPGASWAVASAPGANWSSVASSAEGKKLAGAVNRRGHLHLTLRPGVEPDRFWETGCHHLASLGDRLCLLGKALQKPVETLPFSDYCQTC